MSGHEAQSDTGKEDIVQVRKSDVAPNLSCMGCNGAFRGSVIYCHNKHGLCIICFGDQKKCPITGCRKKAALTLDFPAELVKKLKLSLPCTFKKDGCDQENIDEEAVAEHEIECGYRKVPCFKSGCPDQLVMEMEGHIFSAHDDNYGKYRDNPGKWFINNNDFAAKMWIDSESGLRCRAELYHDDGEKQWRCYTMVFGGKNVAKKFRAEMRLSSHDNDTSHIFNCNLFCLDDWHESDALKEFHISEEQFQIYNKGHHKLGGHNKDKNGKVTVPVTVEVKMKRLNVG